jgi:RNA-dependent RNA polymerase
VVALEDLGVKRDTFMDLQDAVKARIYSASSSLEGLAGLFKDYNIGGTFHLPLILEGLTKLGLGLKETFHQRAFENAFLARVVRGSAYHMLRELKYKARIPVPRSYRLVGVADEGRAYMDEGIDSARVFTLKEGFIYGAFLHVSVVRIPYPWVAPSLCARNRRQRARIPSRTMFDI